MAQKFSLVFSLSIFALVLSSTAQAVRLPGEVQPDRYTYYLTSEYGQALKAQNDNQRRSLYDRKPHGELLALSSLSQAKGVPAPTAMTCMSSIYFNKGAGTNWLKIACVDNHGLEYSANQQWPAKSVAKRVCKVGEARCESFLTLTSDSWSGPQ